MPGGTLLLLLIAGGPAVVADPLPFLRGSVAIDDPANPFDIDPRRTSFAP